MTRKISDLTPAEKQRFDSLVALARDNFGDSLDIKMNIIKKFNLDVAEPAVFDFLTDIPNSPPLELEDLVKKSNSYVKLSSSKNIDSSQLSVLEQDSSLSYANNMDLIVIQNRLLHAISHLTLNERRLILFLSPIVRQETAKDPKNRWFIVKAQDFAKCYDLKINNVYKSLSDTADSILEKAFWYWNYQDNNSFSKRTYKSGVSWVSECNYKEGVGRLDIRLDETVIEMLTVFDKNTGNFWTKYQKEWIINLGTYGIIMLEMVLSSLERDIKGYYTVEHLREKFDCIETYPRFSDFKIRIIDKAIKEIAKHTPIRITYDVKKSGRTVLGVKFSYTDISKTSKISANQKILSESDIFAGLSEDEIRIFKEEADEAIVILEKKNGEALSDEYKTNIYRKAVRERWGWKKHEMLLVEKQVQEDAIKSEQEQREKEKKECEQDNDRMNALIQSVDDILNSLNDEERNAVLDAVQKDIEQNAGYFMKFFKQDPANSHKHPMFLNYYKKILGMN